MMDIVKGATCIHSGYLILTNTDNHRMAFLSVKEKHVLVIRAKRISWDQCTNYTKMVSFFNTTFQLFYAPFISLLITIYHFAYFYVVAIFRFS